MKKINKIMKTIGKWTLAIIFLFTIIICYESSIEGYKKRVNEHKQNINQLAYKVEILQTSLTTEVANNDANTKAIEAKNAEIEDLNKKIAQLKTPNVSGRKTIVVSENNTSETTNTSKQGKYLGSFSSTGYCNCSKCCGSYAGGKTASGTIPKQGRTIAVDPKVIPLGSKVIINGHTYIAEDTGSAIKGNKIDMFFSNHNDALNWGRRRIEVYLA